MCFDKNCVRCCKMCVTYNKFKFITNITNVTGIHTFYFYNNKHIFIATNIMFRASPAILYLALYLHMWRDKMKKWCSNSCSFALQIVKNATIAFHKWKATIHSSLNKKSVLTDPFLSFYFFIFFCPSLSFSRFLSLSSLFFFPFFGSSLNTFLS